MSAAPAAGGDPSGRRGVLRVLDTLTKRLDLQRRLGKTHGDARDLWKTLGYPDQVEPRDYQARYQRGDIAKRIVDAPAQATWRTMPRVTDAPESEEATSFSAAWEALVRRLRLGHRFERADKLAGLGRYAILYLGAPGDPREPLGAARGPEDLRFVQAFGEDRIDIAEVEGDTTSPRFGLPRLYTVDLAGSFGAHRTSGPETLSGRTIHWTRVVHIAEGTLDDDLFGTPRLRPVWNRLLDLEKVLGASGEAAWLTAERGLHFNVDPEADDVDEEALEAEIERYVHQVQRFIRTKGVESKVLGSSVPDPTGLVNALIGIMAGTTGIPQRILMGSERGQLASSQDRASWNERIAERQADFAEPVALLPFIERCVEHGFLPRPRRAPTVLWGSLLSISPAERAGNLQRFSRAVAAYANAKASGASPITDEEFREQAGLPRERPAEATPSRPDPGREGVD